MRALRRFSRRFHDLACRSRRARTRSHIRGTAASAAAIDNAIDPSAHIVGNVKRTVRSDGKPVRTMHSFIRRFHRPREPIREYFAPTGRVVALHRLKNYVVTTLWIGRSVP
jgi:hypothetical protein